MQNKCEANNKCYNVRFALCSLVDEALSLNYANIQRYWIIQGSKLIENGDIPSDTLFFP